jgi:hypothetical protein
MADGQWRQYDMWRLSLRAQRGVPGLIRTSPGTLRFAQRDKCSVIKSEAKRPGVHIRPPGRFASLSVTRLTG